MKMMRSGMMLLAVLTVTIPLLVASETKVGDTKDGCDKSNPVKFQTSSGQVSVGANSPTKGFDLPGLTKEITWYCGGSRERSANDTDFNKVEISRAKNGAIQWTFVRVTAAAAANPETQLGNSKDACDGSQAVTFTAKDGPVTVKAGQSVVKELPSLTKELSWKCGKSDERVANPSAFNFVQLERAGNGALQWYFLRAMSVTDDSIGDYVDMVPGDFIIQAPALKTTLPMPGFLKTQLDTFWDANSKDIQAEILKSLQGDKRYQISKLVLAPSSKAELRVGESATNVLVKYVVHENTAAVSKSGVNLNAVFDIEMVIFLSQQQTLPVQASRATAFVHHFELHGASAGDDFLAAFAKSRIHAVETNTNNFTKDVKKRVNDALKQVSGNLPAPAGTPLVLDAAMGTIQACVKLAPGDVCKFPRPQVPSVVSRKTLDTSHDQCGEANIWIWDYQKGTFVPVAKGGSALIEVDNQRFEWFCGGNGQPTGSNDEWATGPEGTYFVQVRRAASGSQIDWTFQSWH
jgi:hypothetical protein